MEKIYTHPKGFKYVVGTEFFEKICFYGLKSYLLLYMIKSLSFSDEKSFETLGAFMILIYGIPFLGGWIADALWGNYKTLLIGAIVMCIGTILLTLPIDFFFYLGLSGMVVGSGLSKPNLPTLLGKLYEKDNPKRDEGFNLYYFGVNIGSFLAPIICGMTAELFGWRYGFIVANISTFFAILLIFKGRHLLEKPFLVSQEKKSFLVKLCPYLIVTSITIISTMVLYAPSFVENILPSLGAVACATLSYIAFKEKKAVKVILSMGVLMFFFIIFFALYEQMWMSITLFTDRHLDRSIQSLTGNAIWLEIAYLPTSFFFIFCSLYVLVFSPFVGILWTKLGRRGMAPSMPIKGAIGLGLTGLFFSTLSFSGNFSSSDGLVAIWWIVGAYAFLMLAEVLIIPSGLAMVGKFSPKKYVTIIMGIWFLGMSCSQSVAVFLAKWTCAYDTKIEMSSQKSLQLYMHVFNEFAWISYGVGGILLILSYFMRSVFKDRLNNVEPNQS